MNFYVFNIFLEGVGVKKFLKWGGVFFICVLGAGIFSELDSSGENGVPSGQKIPVTDKEYELMTVMIRDDVASAIHGEGIIDIGYIHVTARNLQKDYANNEARGDQLYHKKKIIIDGVVDSISSSIGNTPVVHLSSGSSFNNVMVYFTKKSTGIAASLNKRDRVSFGCIGDGVLIGSPVLKQCQTLADLEGELVKDQMKLVNQYIKGKDNVPDAIKFVVTVVKKMGEKTDEFSACTELNLNCLETALKSLSKDDIEQVKKELE